MFFQIDLEKNSSSPEGAVFSRPDVPGSDANVNPSLGKKDPLFLPHAVDLDRGVPMRGYTFNIGYEHLWLAQYHAHICKKPSISLCMRSRWTFLEEQGLKNECSSVASKFSSLCTSREAKNF